jgi:cell division protein FtsX
MALALLAHACATDMVANDPEGMAIYHFSGAIMDALLCFVVTGALSGLRGRLMGWLMAASIGANVVGYVLYMGYVSPVYYNAAMWSLTAAQALVLLVPRSLWLRIKAKIPSILPWPNAGSTL